MLVLCTNHSVLHSPTVFIVRENTLVLCTVLIYSSTELATSKNTALVLYTDHPVLIHSPTVLVIGENITFVLYAGHTVLILVFRSKHLTVHVLWASSSFSVFRTIIPQQTHHHLSQQNKTQVQNHEQTMINNSCLYNS